jgi:hypothetical protein
MAFNDKFNAIMSSPAFMLGAGILGNNYGHYGEFNPALRGGMNDYHRQMLAQNRAKLQENAALRQQQIDAMNQAKFEAWESDRERAEQQRNESTAWRQQNYPQHMGMPKEAFNSMLQQKFKSQYAPPGSYGTSIHWDDQGNSYQASTTGGLRQTKIPLQKPLHYINTGAQQFGVNPITNRPVGPSFQNKLKPSETPEHRRNVKKAETEGKSSAESESELSDLEASFPRLQSVVNELSELGKKATYTKAGQFFNEMKRQTGMKVGEGAVARKEYISKVDNEILPLLRQTFGAAFTQKEGESLKATLGDPNVSPEEKDAVLRSFIKTKAEQINTKRRKMGKPPMAVPADQNNDPLGLR